MTNTAALNDRIKESGMTIVHIAAKLGISVRCFDYKRNNASDFTAREIEALCQLLQIKSLKEKDFIFFSSV